ncbi:MAG: hypothetical protein K9L22_08180, partial [Methylococcaceae bacterium]|nr:hypothetical protein [Methylococcaceae bacterium]
DRIQLAVSTDAKNWRKKGVVFFVQGANHVNDPSVGVVNNTFYMYYTLAMHGVTDSIGLAVSKDGIRWKNKGVVLKPSKPPKWDSLLVGRPSVLYEKGLFRMWYDGRKDLPLGSPDAKAPKSAKSHRDVGYAESKNGVKWKKRVKFVFGRDAGGIHVSKLDDGYAMLFESRKGTQWATSLDGIKWNYKGVLLQNEMQTAPYGHVTPFLLHEKGGLSLYYGAARANSWDNNFIMMKSLVTESLQ